ncbi:hypothetical protein [Aureibacillus halotolerans]|uniref:Spore coat protein YutH n=1 Tax=Aureibacillus halotolerans TaxID=1508390 RepID=A0A4R6U200_9BACI|nr:hypothetical protein [Aureibacillus halotolerans]TDQ40438.1 spore coat protein YutH [Aureibacillus halotolerans]
MTFTQWTELYGIQVKEEKDFLLTSSEGTFFFAPLDSLLLKEKKELLGWLNYDLSLLLPTAVAVKRIDGGFVTRHLNVEGILFFIRNPVTPFSQTAEALARFQNASLQLNLPVKELSSYGQWPELWAQRLDQWKETESSYTWYVKALGENAISMAKDAWFDHDPRGSDAPVIARRSRHQQSFYYSLPVNWIYDHPARDLAEQLRPLLFRRNGAAVSWLRDFLTYRKLSRLGWTLLIARLLFPLDAIELAESEGSEEQRNLKRQKLEDKISLYESNLKMIIQLGGQRTAELAKHLSWLHEARRVNR